MTAGALPAQDRLVVHPRARTVERAAAAAVVALAAILRLATPGRTPLDPFYDAAVRSMGTSWHAFFVGAFDPSAALAIDKPPLDLWLQVASTKLLGFTPFALLLPAALGGIVAVAALYDLLRTLVGPRVAVVGALALAVLPMEVITARSDTMDSVMAALLITAFAVAARGLRTGRGRNAVAAGALVGMAFEVKLFEALVAALPLALMWWFGARAGVGERTRAGLAAVGACVATGLAWLVALTVAVPAAQRPWAFGSSNGSAWNAAFVYDGLGRLQRPAVSDLHHTLRGLAAGEAKLPAPAGPWRLLSAQDGLGAHLGVMLVGAWLALALLAATRAWMPLDRSARAGIAALATWLTLGTVLFSVQGSMRPRYLEAFLPAIAACLAIGTVLGAGAVQRRLRPLIVLGLVLVLALSLSSSLTAVSAHAEDSGTVGALRATEVAHLSAYLRTSQGGARYELASVATSPTAPLIVREARPVLALTAAGHQVVGVDALAGLVASGEVHDVLLSPSCRTAACTRLSAWVRARGTDVSTLAGLPHTGLLYAVGAS